MKSGKWYGHLMRRLTYYAIVLEISLCPWPRQFFTVRRLTGRFQEKNSLNDWSAVGAKYLYRLHISCERFPFTRFFMGMRVNANYCLTVCLSNNLSRTSLNDAAPCRGHKVLLEFDQTTTPPPPRQKKSEQKCALGKMSGASRICVFGCRPVCV